MKWSRSRCLPLEECEAHRVSLEACMALTSTVRCSTLRLHIRIRSSAGSLGNGWNVVDILLVFLSVDCWVGMRAGTRKPGTRCPERQEQSGECRNVGFLVNSFLQYYWMGWILMLSTASYRQEHGLSTLPEVYFSMWNDWTGWVNQRNLAKKQAVFSQATCFSSEVSLN